MATSIRASRSLVLALLALLLAGLTLVVTAAPGRADNGQQVVAGSWHLVISVPHRTAGYAFIKKGTRTWFFGAGCPVGSACTLKRTTGNSKAVVKTPLEQSANGFTFTLSNPLNCYDTQTGVLSTKHGADYTLTMHVRPTAFAERDGVSYATRLRGAYDETVRINARGVANDCKVHLAGGVTKLVITQHSVITATPVPLAAAPTKTSDTALALDADSTSTSGSLGEFLLPRTTRQADSARAVAAGTRSAVPGSLATPSEVVRSIGHRAGQDLLLLGLLGLLMVFPAQLFNSTYEENHARIDKQLGRLRLRRGTAVAQAPSRGKRLAVFGACLAVGTVLGGLLDPKFGANTPSYALLLGVFVAVLVTVLVIAYAGRTFRATTHHDHAWYMRAIPSALIIAVACVVVSRSVHFTPGYLYGVVGGAVFAVALDRRGEGRAELGVLAVGLVVALGAWAAFEPVSKLANGSHPSFGILTLDSFLASMFIGGVEGLLFGMVPLRFLPGSRIKGWSWIAWGIATAVLLYLFVHVLLQPEAGYLGRSTAASVTLTLILFGAFGVSSVLFWLWFRTRPTPAAEAGHEAPPEDEDHDHAGDAPATEPEHEQVGEPDPVLARSTEPGPAS